MNRLSYIIAFLLTGCCLYSYADQAVIHSKNDDTLSDFPFCIFDDEAIRDVSENSISKYDALIQYLQREVPYDAPLGDIVISAGSFFLKTSYEAATLERNKQEMLVIELHGIDCVTFVEYVTAASLAYRAQQTSFNDFANMLQCLRYRNGMLNGYASRLHYFTDWLTDNSAKGILKIVSNETGTEIMDNTINFMSENAHLYRQLSDDAIFSQIVDVEQKLSHKKFRFIPKGDISLHEEHITDGDIIAFVTSIKGMDVSHTGLAVFINNNLHLMHASTRSNMVEVTQVSLHEYLKTNRSVIGVIIARVL